MRTGDMVAVGRRRASGLLNELLIGFGFGGFATGGFATGGGGGGGGGGG
jgi:hypothetical protein